MLLVVLALLWIGVLAFPALRNMSLDKSDRSIGVFSQSMARLSDPNQPHQSSRQLTPISGPVALNADARKVALQRRRNNVMATLGGTTLFLFAAGWLGGVKFLFGLGLITGLGFVLYSAALLQMRSARSMSAFSSRLQPVEAQDQVFVEPVAEPEFMATVHPIKVRPTYEPPDQVAL